jgi:hypothetical protein
VEGLPERPGVKPKPRNRAHDDVPEHIRSGKPGPAGRKMSKKAGFTPAMRGRWAGKYAINTSGDDAILMFGKHEGQMLSQIKVDDRGYLKWMLRGVDEKFPEDLIDVVMHILGPPYSDFTKPKARKKLKKAKTLAEVFEDELPTPKPFTPKAMDEELDDDDLERLFEKP